MKIYLIPIGSLEDLKPPVTNAEILKMSKTDIMALELRAAANPLAFINKYLFATYMPSNWNYDYFKEVCASVDYILANQQAYNFNSVDIEKLNDISIYFNTLKDYWTNYVSYIEQESGVSVEIAYSLAFKMHVAVLDDGGDTEVIKILADDRVQQSTSHMLAAAVPLILSFHSLHADCLERLQKAWPKYGYALADVINLKRH
jgi:hypothetical protein